MDTVELVMAIEEEFKIQIPNAAAEKMRTPGDILDFVMQALKDRGETPDPDKTWEHIRHIFVEQLGVRLDEVTKTANIVKDLGAD